MVSVPNGWTGIADKPAAYIARTYDTGHEVSV